MRSVRLGVRVANLTLALALAVAHPAAGQLASRPADEWMKTLEGAERVASLKIDEVVGALRLRPGDQVADIGAGPGLFEVPLAKAVGSTGRVYAVDIDAGFFPEIKKRAAYAGVANVQTILGKFTDPALPATNIDVALFHDVLHHAHGLINALTVSIPIDEIEALSRQSSVLSVSVDAVVTADQSDSSYTLRSTLGLPAQSPAGNRIGVAIVDSGIEPGPEFGDRLVGFYDFTNGGRTAQPTDGYGHGTHVAGIIAGDGGLSQKRYRGVAPKARVTGFKVLDKNGTGLTSDVISAIEYATEHRDSLGIDIINLSLGHPIYEPAASDPLVQAVETASRAGIVVVTSAGNYGINPATGLPGYAGVVSPANAPSAITVGAVKTSDTNARLDDRVAPYSSRGPTWYDGMAKPDLVAPGQGLVSVAALDSTLYLNNPDLRVGDSYLSLSGTSMPWNATA